MYNGIFFDEAGNFYDGYACVKLGSKWGIVSDKCELALECLYEGLHYVDENIYAAKLNGQCGLIDRAGNVILNIKRQVKTKNGEKNILRLVKQFTPQLKGHLVDYQ